MRYFIVDVSPLVIGYPGEPGAYMVTDDVNREAADLVAAAHNLDRDNFGEEEILAAHLANKACGQVWYTEIDADNTLALVIGVGSLAPIPVPNASDEPWYREVETGDGMLLGWVLIEVESRPFVSSLQGAVMIDGVEVAPLSPVFRGGAGASSATVFAPFCAPVESGRHRVEVVFNLGEESVGALYIEIGTRAMFLREVLR